MDLATLIAKLLADGSIARVASSVTAQFGTTSRRLLGAEILPERLVPNNEYREDKILYRTVVANDGTRYGPAQIKEGQLVGSFLVELAEMDIAAELTGQQYDALIRYLNSNASMDATVAVLRWVDTVINQAMVENLERQRWEALVDAIVTLRGDNEYSDTVQYSDPTGHRVNAAAAWSNDANDPFDDIHARADFLAGKGVTVNRIVTSRAVLSMMAGNANVKTRVGIAVVNPSGQIQSAVGRATHDAINGVLQADGLPPIELYDLRYRDSVGTQRFMKEDVMVMLGTTDQAEEIDTGDEVEFLENTIGYGAIGRGAGQSAPGRVIRMEHKTNKPPRIEAEGWQTSLPVITEPEAIAVIKSIS